MVNKFTAIVDDLNTLFERDYKEFVRDRRRWKSDFATAAMVASNNLRDVNQIVADCVSQNDLSF